MLAYCTALRLPVGHLIYAKGNQAGRIHRVDGAHVTLRAHALDLSLPPQQLVASVHAIATVIASVAVPGSAGGLTPAGRVPAVSGA